MARSPHQPTARHQRRELPVSDHAELVKRLRRLLVHTKQGEYFDSWTYAQRTAEAASAIEEQAATIARLSSRLEVEVRARHQSTIAAYLPGILRKCIAPGCLNRYETRASFAAHRDGAVAEALGGRP